MDGGDIIRPLLASAAALRDWAQARKVILIFPGQALSRILPRWTYPYRAFKVLLTIGRYLRSLTGNYPQVYCTRPSNLAMAARHLAVPMMHRKLLAIGVSKGHWNCVTVDLGHGCRLVL